jgi:hypothetical protein
MSGEAYPPDDSTYSDRDAPVPGLKRTASPLLRVRRDIMHPMFKELFIDADADALAAEDDRRRRARRSRRARPATITRPAARNRENRPRP